MAGGHLDYLYQLPGPVPAGRWQLDVVGTVPLGSQPIQVDLRWLGDGGQILDTATATATSTTRVSRVMFYSWTSTLPALGNGCGDTLRLRLTPTDPDAGPLTDVFPTLSVP